MSTIPMPWRGATAPEPARPDASAGVPRPVATARHTIVLIAFFVVLTGLGALRTKLAGGGAASGAGAAAHPAAASTVIPLYLSLLAGEWGLVLFVWRAGLRKTGTTFAELVGGRWASARDVLRDAFLGAALWGTWTLITLTWSRLAGVGHGSTVGAFLPQSPLEATLWVALSISAGVCEEFVFRGYLQRQFHAWTKSAVLAIVLQALLFGVSHGYQGALACAKIAAFGVLFGALALWRRSLRPGMIAHALTDVVAGLVR